MGAVIAFWLGKTVFHAWAEEKVRSSPKVQQALSGVRERPFRLALLLRMSPIPSWANNYGLSLTPITFPTFAMATAIGGAVPVAQNVYMGTLASSVAGLLSGEQGLKEITSSVWWTRAALGALSFASTAVLSAEIAKTLTKKDQLKKAK